MYEKNLSSIYLYIYIYIYMYTYMKDGYERCSDSWLIASDLLQNSSTNVSWVQTQKQKHVSYITTHFQSQTTTRAHINDTDINQGGKSCYAENKINTSVFWHILTSSILGRRNTSIFYCMAHGFQIKSTSDQKQEMRSKSRLVEKQHLFAGRQTKGL